MYRRDTRRMIAPNNKDAGVFGDTKLHRLWVEAFWNADALSGGNMDYVVPYHYYKSGMIAYQLCDPDTLYLNSLTTDGADISRLWEQCKYSSYLHWTKDNLTKTNRILEVISKFAIIRVDKC